MIPELVAQYVEFTLSVKNSNTLGEPVKAQIMLQMAQALNVLVPLATGANDQQANTQMAADKHAQDLQISQQKHQMDLVQTAEKHNMDLNLAQQKHDMNMEMAKQRENKPKNK